MKTSGGQTKTAEISLSSRVKVMEERISDNESKARRMNSSVKKMLILKKPMHKIFREAVTPYKDKFEF